MRAAFLVVLAVLANPIREDPTPKSKAKTFQEEILGDWQIAKVDVGGGAIDAPTGSELHKIMRIMPKEILSLVNGTVRQEDSAGYTLDLARKPIAIDIFPKSPAPNKMIPGILKLEGDLLTLCFSVEGTNRPADFTNNANMLQATLQLKRVKK